MTTASAEANYLSAATVTQAKYLLGERASALQIIAVHSKVAAYLEQVGMLTFSTDSLSTGGNIQWGGGGVGVTRSDVGWFAGLRVVVDDQLPIRGTTGQEEQFACYLMGAGALQTGTQFPLKIEAERNVPSLQDLVAVHYSNVLHIPGTTWSSGTDNPDNTALGTAGNWGLAYTEPRLVPVVELCVNSPMGGIIP